MSDVTCLDTEILRLLVQVAWADHEVSEQEVTEILGRAQKTGIAPDSMTELEQALKGELPPQPPNLGYLREHRDEALAAVEAIILSDDEIAEDEALMMEEIRTLLGGA